MFSKGYFYRFDFSLLYHNCFHCQLLSKYTVYDCHKFSNCVHIEKGSFLAKKPFRLLKSTPNRQARYHRCHQFQFQLLDKCTITDAVNFPAAMFLFNHLSFTSTSIPIKISVYKKFTNVKCIGFIRYIQQNIYASTSLIDV